jgi:ABC-2 type transport system ATP-binding protein
VADVMKRVRPQMVLHVGIAGDRAAAGKLLADHPLVDGVEDGTYHLVVTLIDGQHDYSELATSLVTAGHRLTMLKEDEINLETAFMALTKGITS